MNDAAAHVSTRGCCDRREQGHEQILHVRLREVLARKRHMLSFTDFNTPAAAEARPWERPPIYRAQPTSPCSGLPGRGR
eukprot:5883169-Prymnesium_polylepis.2